MRNGALGMRIEMTVIGVNGTFVNRDVGLWQMVTRTVSPRPVPSPQNRPRPGPGVLIRGIARPWPWTLRARQTEWSSRAASRSPDSRRSPSVGTPPRPPAPTQRDGNVLGPGLRMGRCKGGVLRALPLVLRAPSTAHSIDSAHGTRVACLVVPPAPAVRWGGRGVPSPIETTPTRLCPPTASLGVALRLLSFSTPHIVPWHCACPSFGATPSPPVACAALVPQVSPAELMDALEPMEAKIMGKGGLPELLSVPQPWQTPVPPLQESVHRCIEFPAEDEEEGALFMIAWRGPRWMDLQTRVELACLMQYLTESAVSPIRKAMVDCENPVANSVYTSLEQYSVTAAELTFDGIKTVNLGVIETQLLGVLEGVVEQGVDIKRMRDIIQVCVRTRHGRAWA